MLDPYKILRCEHQGFYKTKNPQLSLWVFLCGERGLTALIPERGSNKEKPEQSQGLPSVFLWINLKSCGGIENVVRYLPKKEVWITTWI